MNFNPFYGWFNSVSKISKKASIVIKESMLVLLVLYPIVMLEMRFLNPHLTALNAPLATFIGNTISVSLISFPFMPICLYLFGWWLVKDLSRGKNILGFLIIFALYLLEILTFTYFGA